MYLCVVREYVLCVVGVLYVWCGRYSFIDDTIATLWAHVLTFVRAVLTGFAKRARYRLSIAMQYMKHYLSHSFTSPPHFTTSPQCLAGYVLHLPYPSGVVSAERQARGARYVPELSDQSDRYGVDEV